jgi:two-component system OmpR family sensor kinase
MTRSLRGRLLIGVMSLMVIGLLIFGVTTYQELSSSLLGRIDNQLQAQSTRIAAVIFLGGQPRQRGPSPIQVYQFPSGTVAELVAPDGTVIINKPFDFGSSSASASPNLPKSLPDVGLDHPTAPFTVGSIGAATQYRITDWPEDSFGGNFVVLAIPLTEVQATLDQLLLLEVLIGLALVGATAIVALLVIRIGLRPLELMGGVAADIAAGDLSRRVEPATTKTEIGRLGLALNGMLTQIEAAFAERTASEQRLRRFVADASHELRTPLTSIRGYAEILRRGKSMAPKDSDLARRRIEEESIRMTGLVDDMLTLARLDAGRPMDSQPIDLGTIVLDAVADARVVAPHRQITLSAPRTMIVPGDEMRLRQVVSNLMRNALVHTPPTSPVEVVLTSDDASARIRIIDHGPGLPADARQRIFEPFYRADTNRSRDTGGVGLGLSIVRAIVAAHGGLVRVVGTDGGGATFEVELPQGVLHAIGTIMSTSA